MNQPLLFFQNRAEVKNRVFTWAKKRHLKNIYSNEYEYVSLIYISDSCRINELISNSFPIMVPVINHCIILYPIFFCPFLSKMFSHGTRSKDGCPAASQSAPRHWGPFATARPSPALRNGNWRVGTVEFCCAVNGIFLRTLIWTYKNHAEMMLVKDPWDDLKQKQVCVERKPQKTKWQDKQYVYIYIIYICVCLKKSQ